MPTLRLKTLTCYETEDEWGSDEAYIKVNGETIWGPVKINGAEDRQVDQDVSFTSEATVELWDTDWTIAAGNHLELVLVSSNATWGLPDETRATTTIDLNKSSVTVPLLEVPPEA